MKKIILATFIILSMISCSNKAEKSVIGKWSAEITKEEKIETDYNADNTMVERTYLNGKLIFEHTGIYKLSADNKYLISKDDKVGKFDTMQIVQLTDKELWLKKPDLSFIITMSTK
jgi:hypothetical protein